jgi:hypothetical protein
LKSTWTAGIRDEIERRVANLIERLRAREESASGAD